MCCQDGILLRTFNARPSQGPISKCIESQSFPLLLVFSSFVSNQGGNKGSVLLQKSCVHEVDTYNYIHIPAMLIASGPCSPRQSWEGLSLHVLEWTGISSEANNRSACNDDLSPTWKTLKQREIPTKRISIEVPQPALTKIWPVAKKMRYSRSPDLQVRSVHLHSFALFPIQFWSLSMFNWWISRGSTANFQTKSPRASNSLTIILENGYHHSIIKQYILKQVCEYFLQITRHL